MKYFMRKLCIKNLYEEDFFTEYDFPPAVGFGFGDPF